MKVRLLLDKAKFYGSKEFRLPELGYLTPKKRTGLQLIFLFLICLGTSVFAYGNKWVAEDIELSEALNKLSQKYEVFFSYDEKMIEDVEVSYNPEHYRSIVHALNELLAGTSLRYKIFDNRYIILYEESKEALTSLKGMVRHLESVIDSQEKSIKVRATQKPVALLQRSFTEHIEPLAFNVTGTVSDQDGEPLIGVNIQVKGTNTGTSTNFEGNFTLEDIDENAVLVISYIGYQTQEVSVAGKSVLNITMRSDSQLLDEVVVVGYGTQKKSDLTGAVGSVNGEDIAMRQTSQVSQALQGSTSGVMVTRSSGDPGTSASIRIRGITTIGNSNPLIIVDGIPVGNIDQINPNDIESISVLKDAASASIYGSRAAAGVILVTTKRSKVGELSLKYDFNYGIEMPTERPEVANIIRYMEMNNEFAWNDQGNGNNEYPIFSKDMIENYFELNRQDPNQYPITDWEGLIMKNSAPLQRHNLIVSGGSDNVKVHGSLSYEKTEGLYAHRSFERINSRINTDIIIKKDLLNAKFDLFIRRNIQDRPITSPGRQGYLAGPVYPAVWSDGRVAGGKNGDNPFGQVEYGGTTNALGNLIGGKLELNLTPLAGLNFKALFSPSLRFDSEKAFTEQVPYYDANDPSQFSGYLTGKSRTTLREVRNKNEHFTIQFLSNYEVELADHFINAMVGYEEYGSYTENLGASRDNYEFSYYPYLSIGPIDFRDNYGNAYENAYRSTFGRLMYNYKDKYLLQGNIRFDGSSRFHTDNRWGFFPSLSVGWVLTNESFWERNSTLSYLKLRGSFGTLGNERIGNYPYQSTLGFQPGILFFEGSNIVTSTSAAQIQWAIQDISWEKTESYNLGFDVYFFNNRLQLGGDVYTKKTSDMLLALEIPDFIGFNNPDQNAGSMRTNGWDVELRWRSSIGELAYSVSGNLFDSKTMIEDLSGTEFKGTRITAEGTEYNEWYGYKTDGLFQDQEEIGGSPVISSAVKPGDVKFLDVSGPNGEPDGVISPDYDKVPLGGSLPRYQYGVNLGMEYKNFNFSVVFQGVGKQLVSINNEIWPLRTRGWYNAPLEYDGNYWSVYNSVEKNLNAKYPRLSDTGDDQNFTLSDYWLVNGAYLRIKNINLGYNLPHRLTENLQIDQITIFGNISDLYSFDSYIKGYDTEAGSTAYPITTTFMLGASVKF